jgi:hypothetical protein
MGPGFAASSFVGGLVGSEDGATPLPSVASARKGQRLGFHGRAWLVMLFFQAMLFGGAQG